MILKRTEGNRGRSLERRNWLPSSPFLADRIHVRRLGLKLDKNYKAPRVQRSGKKSQPESGTKFYCNGKYSRLCYKCFTMFWYSAILCPFSLISASASACLLVAFVIYSVISSSFFCRHRKKCHCDITLKSISSTLLFIPGDVCVCVCVCMGGEGGGGGSTKFSMRRPCPKIQPLILL